MKWFKTCLIWIWLSKKYCAFIRPLSGNSLTSIYTVAENINLTLLWCRVERQCTKDYSYDNGRIKIKKGQLVTVPAFALHHMEEYYPDSEKFDPERLVPLPKMNCLNRSTSGCFYVLKRWSPENKANRNPYTFMAFGVGPRNCLGMRFALEEMKIAICCLVQKFRFFPVEETPVWNK